MNIQEEKKRARKEAFVRRASAFNSVSANIVSDVLKLAEPHNVVSAYMPIRTEIDSLPAMNALIEAGKIVAIPVIDQDGAPLRFCQWSPQSVMIDGEFGALIPEVQINVTPTLILAPLVAFDALGIRLGYGGGFYDRTLADLRKQNDCSYWGLAFSKQESPELLPAEPTDIRLDGIITEKGAQFFEL